MQASRPILASLAGIAGVVMLVVSFSINPGPPANATSDQLVAFGNEYFQSILWGSWLQAVGPLLTVFFAFAIVIRAGAATRLAGWMVFLGGALLMMVSLTEITFYIAALTSLQTAEVSQDLIHAVQHLYFFVGAPSLFIPLGYLVVRTRVLPGYMGFVAIGLGSAFLALGVAFLYSLVLPVPVLAFAGIQAFWWVAAAVLMLRPANVNL